MVKGRVYCVIMLVTDRIRNNNTDQYTVIYKFPVFTEKIEHAHTVCTLFRGGGAWGRG